MNILKGVFLIMSLAVGIDSYNGSHIIIPNPSNVSIIGEAIVNVIKNCLPDVMNIFLGCQLAPETITELNGLNTLATVKLDDLSSINNLQYFHKKIDLLILNNTSALKFLRSAKHCQKLRVSTNGMIVFLLCEMDKIKNIFVKILSNLWKCDFLYVYSFCLDSKNQLKIFTFNPYTNRTINEWNEFKLTSRYSRKKLGKRWTFYHRKYLKENICQEFVFDRNKNLDGYPVIAAFSKMKSAKRNKMVALIENALKVKVQKIRILSGAISQLNRGNNTYDFTLSSYSIYNVSTSSRFSLSQPLYPYSMFIVTQNRGLLTPLEKIYNYYGYVTVISTMIILAMTFIVIYLSEHDITFASFEIIRLLINTGIKTRMETNKSRIFFSMIFLYFLIIHGTFSGRLAGFLTKAEYRKNVEALEDLKDPRYKRIYATVDAREYINDTDIKSKTIFGKYSCGNVIKNNSSVACIKDYLNILPLFKQIKLYTSKKPLLTKYYYYLIRSNWPLASRFNDLMIWCIQSGLSQKWYKDEIAQYVRRIEIAKAQSLRPYRPITFDDLKFSFLLLGFGLALSIISLIFEIVIQKKYYSKLCKKIKRMRTQCWIPIASIRLRIKEAFIKFISYWELTRRRGLNNMSENNLNF